VGRPAAAERPSPGARRASAVIGSPVALRGGGALGEGSDIVIGPDGHVDYLIVGYRGELLAVPWGAVTYTPGERTLSTTGTITRDRLRDMTFRETAWPDFYADRWTRTARSVWGDRVFDRHPPRRSAPDLPGGTANPEDRRPPR